MNQEYDDLSLEELRDLCKERGLKVSGNKDELVARLELADIEKADDDSDSTPVEGDEDESSSDSSDDDDSDSDDDGDDDGPDPDDDPAGGQAPEEEPETTEAQGVEVDGSVSVGWKKGERKGRLPDPEPTPVAPIRGSTSQEGTGVKGAFQFAVLPDGRRVPIQGARDEGEE